MDLKQDIIKRLGSNVVNVEYWPNGIVKYRSWYKNSQCHRDNDLPAYEEFYENGNIRYRNWYKNGVFVKRKEYRLNGSLESLEWWEAGHFNDREEYNEQGDVVDYCRGVDFP